MKTFVLLILLLLNVVACAHIITVAKDNRDCPGIVVSDTFTMYQKARMLPNESAALILRDEASICKDLYMSFVRGIIDNRSISKSFAKDSFDASCNDETVCTPIFERYWADGLFEK